MKINYKSPKGVPDILREDQKYFDFIVESVEKRCFAFGFEKITLPIFEDMRIYQKGTGINTDVIQKEMYEVTRLAEANDEQEDKNKKYVLRPEFTPGIARAYLEHGMFTRPQPVKILTVGPVFRHDKPQKGRYRQFHQFNTEIIGSQDPLTDSLMILLVWQIFVDIGLRNEIVLEINNIGCRKCQPKIRKKFISLLEPHQNKLCQNCQNRIYSNPLRILDCKNKNCQKVIKNLPHIIDLICSDCKKHFMQVLEYLDELKVPYDLNPFLVRGLDYYTLTTFEVRDKNDPTKQLSFGGGGRYDNLIQLYGGPNTPALGYAGGIERIIDKLKEKEINIPTKNKTEIYIIQLGEKAKKYALNLISDLTEKNFHVGLAVGKNTISSQLKAASRAKAKLAIIIGQKEIIDKTIIVKDLDEAIQETIDQKDLEDYLTQNLNK
jgi:histidyl-tRNA synthetase